MGKKKIGAIILIGIGIILVIVSTIAIISNLGVIETYLHYIDLSVTTGENSQVNNYIQSIRSAGKNIVTWNIALALSLSTIFTGILVLVYTHFKS